MSHQLNSKLISKLAVDALINEAELTPKPGLVDRLSRGAHKDMDIELMLQSAKSLESTFYDMAEISYKRTPDEDLFRYLVQIGRHGEKIMFAATEGVNTHKGAIWSIGLLAAAAAISRNDNDKSPLHLAQIAGRLARFRQQPPEGCETNGMKIRKIYGVLGAVGEAQSDFINVIKYSLPVLNKCREAGIPEDKVRIDALMALMANVNDTCVLYRGGEEALEITKQGAYKVLTAGGAGTEKGYDELLNLDKELIKLNVSPGGSADLLAATLFLDSISNVDKIQ